MSPELIIPPTQKICHPSCWYLMDPKCSKQQTQQTIGYITMNEQMIYCLSTTLAHATPSNQGKSSGSLDVIITIKDLSLCHYLNQKQDHPRSLKMPNTLSGERVSRCIVDNIIIRVTIKDTTHFPFQHYLVMTISPKNIKENILKKTTDSNS